MYRTSKNTQERKDAKRQFLLDTAAKVFASKGFHNTSVKDIVEEADISVGSFYFYFKSKEEMFMELYLSIEKSFQNIAQKVIDVENYPMDKNFTRVLTANLWMYECNRDMAKIFLIEAAGINAEFQEMRAMTIGESAKTMAGWFQKFQKHEHVNIPDERVAALIYEGTFYYLINDWLRGDSSVAITDSAYALCVYNLQALGIPFESDKVKEYIREIRQELKKDMEQEK